MKATAQINNPILQINSEGAFVTELQQLLNLFDYKLTVDGFFGSSTQKAVKAFQASKPQARLAVDGVVGHKTWTTLYTTVFRAAPNAMPILEFGSTGEAVQLLQNSLNQFKNLIAVDGDFGTTTEAAVKMVQRNNRLTVDGVVGSKTWIAISKMENE